MVSVVDNWHRIADDDDDYNNDNNNNNYAALTVGIEFRISNTTDSISLPLLVYWPVSRPTGRPRALWMQCSGCILDSYDEIDNDYE